MRPIIMLSGKENEKENFGVKEMTKIIHDIHRRAQDCIHIGEKIM